MSLPLQRRTNVKSNDGAKAAIISFNERRRIEPPIKSAPRHGLSPDALHLARVFDSFARVAGDEPSDFYLGFMIRMLEEQRRKAVGQ